MKRFNRLHLDFGLNTNKERTEFVQQYMNQITFKPTEVELETIANYILWGKDPETGLNSKQDKSIQLESKHKTWDARQDESLDALLETPGFTESMIRPSTEPTSKVTRQVFSREEARKLAAPSVLKRLEDLWGQIDRLDLLLNFYDLRTGKRKTDPRPALLEQFTQDEITQIQEKSNSLNQFKYLKLRHLLVELRREQFTLRDTYISTIMCTETPIITHENPPTIDAEILCVPVGLMYTDRLTSKLFPRNRYPIPEDFSENELKPIIDFYWKRQSKSKKTQTFDFRELEHIYQVLQLFDEMIDETIEPFALSTMPEFINTLNWYVARANLNEIHQQILQHKINHHKNQDIADDINTNFNKSYTANYISTIFRQKIIPQINNAARQHCEIIENLCFPENWKKCKCCGDTLLINTDNFVRKARSSDGFSNQCKRCDKTKRQMNK